MSFVVLAIGLVLVVEGLVFALAPSRLDELVDLIRRIPPETRRFIGLVAVALGTALIWLAQRLAG
ncbi:DUF2065 domain-containing protein [Rhodovulum tesquicola]|uniref:DUF2065 domain-containing protein n=1 Tax=Rhodovulum steppense TaxID=540251 RepID=A0A4R1YV31_9RHOB|nr:MULTISPECIES: DUF2065 domain-containing protein [Rhodovulum]MCO8145664.1 DUF2065 domain-containing protein [Rhodovulum tesquicola]TCM84968.1 hypothetical protein EV216_10953 [Rhodovulum steppense]